MNRTPMETFPPSPPTYSNEGQKDGYSSLPRADPYVRGPPTGYSPPAPVTSSAYTPAPPVFQQQTSNNNVVVVGNQPTAAPTIIEHVSPPRANEYLCCTIIMIVLCCLHGDLPAIILLLVPALICACVARDHNRAGEYEDAKSCGLAALTCNIIAIVYFVLLVVATVVTVVLLFVTGVLSVNNIAKNHCCEHDLFTSKCTRYCTLDCSITQNFCFDA